MTDPNKQPYDVVISDQAWGHMRDLPPEALDELAQALAALREDPENAPGSIRVIPAPVDHSEGREDTYVPATRSISYLRNAVADISPPTVRHFDEELAEATRHTEERGVNGQIHGLRVFVLRWVEYIAIQGNHALARHIDQADTIEETAARYTDAMATVHREYFPDAGDEAGQELSVQLRRVGRGWTATCPITQLRAEGPTEQAASGKLRALLMEWITG